MSLVRYIAQLILEIDGQPASQDLIEDILQISVEESLHLPGMFTLVINNPYFPGRTQEHSWKHQNSFTMGKSIKLGFSASTTKAREFSDENQGYVLDGEITAIETYFSSESEAPIVIRGYDVAHRLHRGRYNRSFQNMTDTDIVKQIIGEAKISAGAIDASGGPYGYGDIGKANGYVFQQNQTNMEFLRQRATRIGFELFVQDGKLYFRKPTADTSLTLKWLRDIHSFRVRVTSAEQVSSVEVRGWDYKQKQPIVSTKESAQVLTTTDYGKGTSTSTAFPPSTQKMIVVDQPVFSATEADKIAQALLDELGGEFVQADARAEGNPQIRPGKVVNLSDMGKYSGSYYVTATRHLYHKGGYTTEFSVRGLRGGDLLTTLSPPTRLRPGQTPLVGIVTNNKDPNGWSRVRVKFPTLADTDESYWARVVAIGAGSGRGFDCLPEINDEVLVAFENGDIHRPYIIGGVWNGQDAPPEPVDNSVLSSGEAGHSVRLRTFKTTTGHQLQFVETDKDSSKKGVYVDTVYGHQVHLNDSEKFVEIKTNGGHTVRLDDSDKTISMTSTGDINIKAGKTGMTRNINVNAGAINLTGTQTITLKVGGNTIEITQSGITIQAVGIVNVQGTLIKLN